ncbi:MAG: ABC transporter permease [Oscillospiraceae bacterium]|nr:ABC transporter permease [Oscillospiraceae bacterium]
MKNTLKQVFRSANFRIGFIIIVLILLLITIYPIFSPGNPLQMIGYDSFIPPGLYVSLYDSLDVPRIYTLRLEGADQIRIYAKLRPTDRELIRDWLLLYSEYNEVFELRKEDINLEDTEALLGLWWTYFDPEIRFENLTIAERRAFARLDTRIDGIFDLYDKYIWTYNPETGEQELVGSVTNLAYINVSDVTNVRLLPLGTDNFGRDMFKQLVSAITTSLAIGLIAGLIATMIGLVLGLLSGYLSGFVDDVIMFFTNLFTVIPGIVLLILISYSIGQEQRGPATVAIVIGLTSWVWTTRSVRAQVLSLRNRDHVNLSKLSGHSLPRIVIKDILPYIASYVVMAFILQVSSAILAEAGLSMLGLGPRTTETATLGLMMNWAMRYTAHLSGAWWAYYPVILVIALISFALNLINTGLDRVFNPQLRD